MISRMMQLINASDSRYLSANEQQQLLEYARSMPNRLEAAKAVQEKEDAIVERCLDELRRQYPRFEVYHEHGWEKGRRDLQLVLRYAIQAMLMDDVTVAEDKVYSWMRTALAGASISPQMVKDTFTNLRDAVRKHVAAEVFTLLAPHLEHALESLSAFPEPALAAV